MKMILLFMVLMAFIIGCGGGGSSSDSGGSVASSSAQSSSASVALKYNYNNDGASLQALQETVVNQYLEIQEKLNRTKANQKEFDSILAGFIGSLFRGATPTDGFASYAPRGEMKSKIVSLKNNTVDYSDYVLKADIDFNSIVDSKDLDLLSTALFKGYESSEYDLNGDGSVNTADIIYLVARFGSEIKSYAFYTTSGEKLPLASRSVDDPRSFTYNGIETEIMLVAKDINGASGFETGVSDSDDTWYKQTGWTLQSSETFSLNRKTRKLHSTKGERADEFLQRRDDVYLLGWNYDVDYYGNLRLPADMVHPLTSQSMSTIFDAVIELNSAGFKKTDMKHPAEKSLTERKLRYSIGALVDKENFYIETHIMKSTYIRDGKTIEVREMLFIIESLYYSLADKFLVGSLEAQPSTLDVKGTIIAERIGPDPKVLEFPVETIDQDELFSFDDVPFGTYDLNYLDECLCRQALDENFVFESDDIEPIFTIDMTKVTVTLELLDGAKKPISGESIALLAKECVNSDEEEKSFNATTDSNGKVLLQKVPIGDYIVFVGDKTNSEINVCDTYVGTLTSEALWDIDITFAGRLCNYQKSVKNVKIAGINEPLKSWNDYISNPTEYPFPLQGERGAKILVNTNYYTNEDFGILLEYYPNGLDGNGVYNNGLVIAPEEILQMDECIGDTAFGDPNITPTWNGINTVLNSSQVTAFHKYQAFTLYDTGRWINDEGDSTLTVIFKPSN